MRKGKRSRKTVRVVDLIVRANHMFKHSIDSEKDGRKAIALFLAAVLMDADRYNGYGFLTEKQMKDSHCGTTIGINDTELPCPERFENTDDTRRIYY